VPAFKRFLRAHQVPSEIFFSAYPEETIVNMTSDLALAHACGDATDVQFRAAMQRL
jgi:hypothetical protein